MSYEAEGALSRNRPFGKKESAKQTKYVTFWCTALTLLVLATIFRRSLHLQKVPMKIYRFVCDSPLFFALQERFISK